MTDINKVFLRDNQLQTQEIYLAEIKTELSFRVEELRKIRNDMASVRSEVASLRDCKNKILGMATVLSLFIGVFGQIVYNLVN